MAKFAVDSRVVFDLGMNNGDDADYYLKRGFTVIGLEANPALCEKATSRFAEAIAQGRLVIVNAAIWESTGEKSFYINVENDLWSSLDAGWAGRNNTAWKEINVPCVTLSMLFREYTVPYYLKIDVEGADHVVLKQLEEQEFLPKFVSVEDCRFGFQYMETLAGCGYNGFRLVDQSRLGGLRDPVTGHVFLDGSSGPIGDTEEIWVSHARIIEIYTQTVRDFDGTRLAPRTQWWDIHCTNKG